MAIVRVFDLELGFCASTFVAKIVRKFECVRSRGLYREFILSDRDGHHVQATVLPGISLETDGLEEGQSVHVSKFLAKIQACVFYNTSSFYQLYFGSLSDVVCVPPITPSTCIRFSSFEWLLSPHWVAITKTVHLVGRLVFVGNTTHHRILTAEGIVREDVPALMFYIRDKYGREIKCIASGSYVDSFAGMTGVLCTDRVICCALYFWRAFNNEGSLTVFTGIDGISDLKFDPSIPEVDELKLLP